MGGLHEDDYLSELLGEKDSFGIVSGHGDQLSKQMKYLHKELNFAKHYGMGTAKIADMIADYAASDVEAVMAMFNAQKEQMAPTIGHLFLGGSMHGKRMPTHGQWMVTIPLPSKPSLANPFKDPEVYGTFLPKIEMETYVVQKLVLPGTGPENYAEVFILQDSLTEIGAGNKDNLIAEYMRQLLSPKQNSVNTPVLPPLPEPTPAPDPVPPTDGLRITIGGRTIEWTPDDSQLAGLLSWAAQSLGPGKESS